MDILLEVMKFIVPAFLGVLAGRYLKAFDRQKERDKEVYERFMKALSPTAGMWYIHVHDLAAAIRMDNIHDLWLFAEETSKRADFIFVDRGMEKKKQQLAQDLLSLLHRINDVTQFVRDEPFIVKMPQAHTMEHPDQWRQMREELNEKADRVYKLYCDLVAEGRKKL